MLWNQSSDMGSFSLTTAQSSTMVRPPSPLTAMRKVTATCHVTNKIDIDMYFEALKKATVAETKEQKSKRSDKRSSNSNKSENVKSPRNSSSSSRRKNSRKSSDEEEKEHFRSTRKLGFFFNYDLSGHVIDKHDHDVDQQDHCIISRQKSLDLSLSKMKGAKDINNNDSNFNNENVRNFSQTFSAGDFHEIKPKTVLHHSKSLDCVDELSLRHHEHAMNHGKINSVSEQNRRSRHKYYKKKKYSITGDDDVGALRDSIDRKLSLQ